MVRRTRPARFLLHSLHGGAGQKAGSKVMNWRTRLEFTGICMAAVAFLLVITQLAAYWRFSDVDEWAYAVLEHGSPEQFISARE
jgi:hypothetical protein